jgi:uncharacterized protein
MSHPTRSAKARSLAAGTVVVVALAAMTLPVAAWSRPQGPGAGQPSNSLGASAIATTSIDPAELATPPGGATVTHLAKIPPMPERQRGAWLQRMVQRPKEHQPSFRWYEGTEQVAVIGEAGAQVRLFHPGGAEVGAGTVDHLGGLVLRDVEPGSGYVVTYQAPGAKVIEAAAIRVRDREDHPAPEDYLPITIENGFGYLPTRDGTLLSYNAFLPAGPGPHPTLVEYSGYDPSNPDNLPPTGMLAQLLGYGYVAVNMRGTGCSGGAFDYFEISQSLDGYDLIEAVGAQPWSGNVGMIGISYPGISQLFVAHTQPPSLTAITPVSVISDTVRSTLFPGGILNDGFALDWAEGRQADARYPNGQRWAQDRIDAGDEVCAFNQRLRGQNPDMLELIEESAFYRPEFDELAPYTFVDRIQVPTFIAGAWQDEQTGGHFPEMLDRFHPDTYLRFIGTNGTHVEPFGPDNLMAMLEFLSFFVKEEVPIVPPLVRTLAPVLYIELLGTPAPPGALPPDRFAGQPFDQAFAAYLAEDRFTVRLENGVGPTGTDAGFFRGSFSLTSPTWPMADTDAWVLHLQPDGGFDEAAAPTGAPPATHAYDPDAQPRTNYRNHAAGCGSSSMWRPRPVGNDGQSCYAWLQPPEHASSSFVTDPLAEPLVLAGPASADLWIGSNAADVDLEVVLSEVRPDGQEMYVQTGYLRAGHRALDHAASTPLSPRHLHTEEAYQPLPPDGLVEARIHIHPFSHVFRPGSRLRLTVEAPGGNRPLWTFDVLRPPGPTEVRIGQSAEHPSRLVLPRLAGAPVPGEVLDRLPSCLDVRSQPCRPGA